VKGKYYTTEQMWNKKGFCPFRKRIKNTLPVICSLTKSLCCYWCSDEEECKEKQCPGDGQIATINCREEK